VHQAPGAADLVRWLNRDKESATVSEAKMAGGHARQVRDLWDSRAGDWPARYANGQLTGRLPLFSGQLQAWVNSGEVLDLGCGSGELALHLASLGYTVTGCDISA